LISNAKRSPASLYRSPHAYMDEMAQYDAFLKRIPVPHESVFIQTSFGETHVLTMGKDNTVPVIMMHGLGANALSMREMAVDLSKSYRVYVLDAVGYSGKSAATRPPMEGYARWFVEAVNGLNVKEAHVVGISLGGWLAMKLDLLAPERVKSLTLIGSAGFMSSPMPIIIKTLWISATSTLPFAGHRNAKQFLKMLTAPSWQQDPLMVEVFYRLLKYFKAPREIPSPLADDDLRKVTAPTLILMGQYDRLVKVKAAMERARKLLPNLRAAEIVPDVGHLMNTEKPYLVNTRILNFLKDGK
jgi:pimeloyl-ACP methyl ester carboxylesterase